MVDNPRDLDEETQQIISEELDRRYLTSIVDRVNSVRNEYGTSYWEVETNRGSREFVVQNVSENAQWFGDYRLLLVDVDGNRFEIENLQALDRRSLGFVELVI